MNKEKYLLDGVPMTTSRKGGEGVFNDHCLTSFISILCKIKRNINK
jgi:hypothetical protein